MRIVPLLLAFLVIVARADAQTPAIDHIEVSGYGIFAADITTCNPNKLGIQYCDMANVRLATRTATIPAQKGVTFGLTFQAAGMPDGATVTLRKVWIYPPDGLDTPASAQPVRRLQDNVSVVIGRTGMEVYNLTDVWELAAGDWTLELWDGDRRLVSQHFTLVKAGF